MLKESYLFLAFGFLRRPELPAVHFPELFGNPNPVEIEIGCGKGKYLLTRAMETPAINFLGLDRAGKWMMIGKKKSDKRNLANLIFLKAEVREFLERIAAGSIRGFHIYFPDPWPKRRHRKRRLVDAGFLAGLEKKLAPSGWIEMATDDPDYFEQMKSAARATAPLWGTLKESCNQRIKDPHIKTNYELKYETAGRPLHYLELIKP